MSNNSLFRDSSTAFESTFLSHQSNNRVSIPVKRVMPTFTNAASDMLSKSPVRQPAIKNLPANHHANSKAFSQATLQDFKNSFNKLTHNNRETVNIVRNQPN